jgi:hypothetical protein
MEQSKPITREEVIGKRVKFVLQLDLPYDKKEDYQDRLIIIELESGLRFLLVDEKEVLDKETGFGIIYPYVGSRGLYCEIDSQSNANLRSPIKGLFLPSGWIYGTGVLLENGFIIYTGFGMQENGVLFHASHPENPSEMVAFELPSANSAV